jgi:hypothetical protein
MLKKVLLVLGFLAVLGAGVYALRNSRAGC